MSFKVLIAASPSFTNEPQLQQRCKDLFRRRPDAEMHCLTQPHWTAMVKKQGFTVVHVRDFAMYAGEATTQTYNEVIERMDAAIIFWDGESKPEQKLIQRCVDRPLQHQVIEFESLKQELTRLKAEGKITRKPRIVLTMPYWCRERYIEAHKANQLRITPQAVKDFGFVKTQIPKGTTNGLSTFLCNYFNWTGHHLERINNQGVKRGDKWTKGSGTNGTTDTGGHYNSLRHTFAIPIKPEIKTGKDKLSNDQEWFAKKMERTGAIHTVITCFEDVFKFEDYLKTL